MHGIQFCVILSLMIFKLLKCSEKRHMQPLIVHGEYAKIENFPHSVFIHINCFGQTGCGSSILNQVILLTAAHCLRRCDSKGKIHAYAGHENIFKAMVKRRGKSVLIHEGYSKEYHNDDIGLIFLEKSLPLGNTMKRVILTKQNSVGLTAMVAGWGTISDLTKVGTRMLRSAKQIVKHLSTCLLGRYRPPGLTCAGSADINLPRPSHGDSGSALVTDNYKQIGLVSFKYPSHPGLIFYTNTSHYYDWIKENSRFLLNCKINNTTLNKLRNYYELNF